MVWQWPNNHHRWLGGWSPMQLWLRPHFWSGALNHLGGFPVLYPSVETTSVFDNQFDQLFDDFVDANWAGHPLD